jgi:prepilin-type N-terminal cleavage/methylation domain-containing protein/prepilin-type processing-associated H-X9-DG protein
MKIPHRTDKISSLSPKGFTLTEALVVIAIIVILAVLTTLGVARVRSAARGATCTSNLRQIGAAMIAYTTDNAGQLPPLEIRDKDNKQSGIWTTALTNDGYLPLVTNKQGKLSRGDGVWACPDCTDPRGTGKPELAFNGYGVAEPTVLQKSNLVSDVNKREGKNDIMGSLRLSQIPNPERTWLVGDTANTPQDLKTGWYAIWANPQQWTSSHSPAARHAKKVNVCMVDGHVESLTMQELLDPNKNYTMFK